MPGRAIHHATEQRREPPSGEIIGGGRCTASGANASGSIASRSGSSHDSPAHHRVPQTRTTPARIASANTLSCSAAASSTCRCRRPAHRARRSADAQCRRRDSAMCPSRNAQARLAIKPGAGGLLLAAARARVPGAMTCWRDDGWLLGRRSTCSIRRRNATVYGGPPEQTNSPSVGGVRIRSTWKTPTTGLARIWQVLMRPRGGIQAICSSAA